MLREPSSATSGYSAIDTVFQSNVRSCSSQWNCVTPSANGLVPLSAGMLVPLSTPNQTLLPLALRGPSQILSIASASAGVRQLAAGAVSVPQTFAWALNEQVRGSSIQPSTTPSFPSQAATADAV